jgi:hypothetical protein
MPKILIINWDKGLSVLVLKKIILFLIFRFIKEERQPPNFEFGLPETKLLP